MLNLLVVSLQIISFVGHALAAPTVAPVNECVEWAGYAPASALPGRFLINYFVPTGFHNLELGGLSYYVEWSVEDDGNGSKRVSIQFNNATKFSHVAMIGMLNQVHNGEAVSQNTLDGQIPFRAVEQKVFGEAPNFAGITTICVHILPNDFAARKALAINFIRSG